MELGKHPVSDRDEVIVIIKAETCVPTPTVQASPKVPGFEMVVGISAAKTRL